MKQGLNRNHSLHMHRDKDILSLYRILLEHIYSVYLVKGRFIGEIIQITYDIIDHCNKHDTRIEGLLVLVDLEKAFDSINYMYLLLIQIGLNRNPSLYRDNDILSHY